MLTLLSCLPRRLLYALAPVVYLLARHVFRYRRTVVAANLMRAFPHKTHAERQQIEKDFYRHLADVVVEIPMLARMTNDELRAHVQFDGVELLQQQVAQQQSFLLIAAHHGNWEWMVSATALYCPCPMSALYRPLHSASADHFFRQLRGRFGAELLPAEDAGRAILKRRKEVRAVGFIADQTPRRGEEKMWMDFLGTETPIFPGPDRLAKLTRQPVFFIGMTRLKRGYYRCTIKPLAQPPYDDTQNIAVQYMQAVAEQVTREPALWLWSHERWRYPRSECPPHLDR